MFQWLFIFHFIFSFSAQGQEMPADISKTDISTEAERPVRLSPSQDIENYPGEIYFEKDIAQENAEFSQKIGLKDSEVQETIQKIVFPYNESLDLIYSPASDFSKITFVMIAGLESDIVTFKKTKDNLQLQGFGVLEILSQKTGTDSMAVLRESQHIISVINQLGIDETKVALAAYSYGVGVGAQVAFDLFHKQKISVQSLSLINLAENNPVAHSDFANLFLLLKNSPNLHSLLSIFTLENSFVITSLEEQFSEVPIELRGVFRKLSPAELTGGSAVVADAISNFLEEALPRAR
jgi:hypothetical protein